MALPARTTDPITSHMAAADIVASGGASIQRRRAAAAVRLSPGRTSLELAHAIGIDRYELARRLPECEREGLVKRGDHRRCMVSGKQAVTWWGA